MTKPLSRYLRLVFLLGDLAIINLSAFVSFNYFVSETVEISSIQFELLLAGINGFWLLLSILINPYKFSRVSRFVKIIRVHFSFLLIYILTILAFLFVLPVQVGNLRTILTMFGLSVVFLFGWRVFYFYLNRAFINKKLNYKNVVIIGFGDLAWEMRKFFRLHPELGYRFLGYFDQQVQNKDVAPLEELDTFCKGNNVHEIYCCLPYTDNSKVKNLIDYGISNLIKVKLITDYRSFFSRGINLERYDNIPVLNVAAVPLDDRMNQILKRVFDLLFSTVVIVFLLSWMVPLIALLIKLDSKGPVFFKQKRAGKLNTPFNCLKFRTMVVHQSEFKQATKDDPRITTIGKFLRKTSLDEFPQFFNVLTGEMSIIGPRPHPLKLNEEFHSKIEKFMARHYVKPGITGLAQAKGFRGETKNDISMKSRVKLDRFYIENWSFLLDMKIIYATIVSLVKGDQQAY